MTWLWWVMLACVLDRTGQSASERMRRELVDHGTRVANLEAQFIQVEARVNQLEDLTRSQGQTDIMKMESLDELRTALSRIRGKVEVLGHEVGEGGEDLRARAEDVAYRVQWLESRAEQLENALGLQPPSPPPVVTAGQEGGQQPQGQMEGGAVDRAPGVQEAAPQPGPRVVTIGGDSKPNPDTMVDGAKGLLDQDNPSGAEQMLERFLQLHPTHGRVAEARYLRAGAAKKAGKYPTAILRYQEVIDQHKMTPWASWAMYKQGECFGLQGKLGNARVFFNEVIRIFPGSPAAAAAKQQLGN